MSADTDWTVASNPLELEWQEAVSCFMRVLGMERRFSSEHFMPLTSELSLQPTSDFYQLFLKLEKGNKKQALKEHL